MKEELHKNHRKRLRERFARDGVDSLEEHELLELLLFEFQPRVNTNPTAHRLLEHFSSLDAVLHATPDELTAVQGIGKCTAEKIANAAQEEYRRRERILSEKPVSTFPRAANYLIGKMRALEGPRVVLLMLDGELRLIKSQPLERASVLLMTDACITEGAAHAIVGVSREFAGEILRDADLFERFGVKLCDIIVVDGPNAESLLAERGGKKN